MRALHLVPAAVVLVAAGAIGGVAQWSHPAAPGPGPATSDRLVAVTAATRACPPALGTGSGRVALIAAATSGTAAGRAGQAELTPLMTSAFGSWKAPAAPALEPVVPTAPKGPWPRLIVVDRQDAPQAVIAALKPGVAASDPQEPPLWRVNDAIGGSFTSRLNQDLREEHGYTYGARSRFSRSRGPGQVVAWANVVTDKTGDALAAMLADLKKFSDGGMTDDEVSRTRTQAREELVSVYQSDEGIAGHLAADASLGLPPDWATQSSKKRDAATKADLDALAKEFYGVSDAIIVVVGPLARIQPMIDGLGLPAPEVRDAEGRVVPAGAKKPAAPSPAPAPAKTPGVPPVSPTTKP